MLLQNEIHFGIVKQKPKAYIIRKNNVFQSGETTPYVQVDKMNHFFLKGERNNNHLSGLVVNP